MSLSHWLNLNQSCRTKRTNLRIGEDISATGTLQLHRRDIVAKHESGDTRNKVSTQGLAVLFPKGDESLVDRPPELDLVLYETMLGGSESSPYAVGG